MKFGRKLKTDQYKEWQKYYLDYTALKRQLKDRTSDRFWNADDEQEWTQLLEDELDKIHNFQRSKTAELASRIRTAEGRVKQLVVESDTAHNTRDRQEYPSRLESQEHGVEQDGGSDDDLDSDDESDSRFDGASSTDLSIHGYEDRFRELEEEVATLVADVHDLALYTKLNFTGFMKIVKKHDKQTGLALKATFMHDFLEKRPFYKYNWDGIIVKLSKLYDLVRTRGHPVQGDSSAGGSQSAFVRQTTKYWVHPDNLVHLKLAILRHLPVLVFNPNKEFEPADSAITSIYFDNEDLELYLGRLEKTEGAEAVRLRWYGPADNKQIFVERKTHREDWTGEKSVKARFPIKVQHVNAFLRGEYTMDEEFEALVAKGKKTPQEVEGMIQLANEVQYAIVTRKLQPVMRTFYNRTAFQLPGDARVRISLDTELTMVREDDWDGRQRSAGNWRRTDIGIDWPFDQIPAEDKEPFKYGVLEVKLQTQYGQEPPAWVKELVESHLVEAVPKFSKFIHGCATLLSNRVDLVPFWLPQMDTDIRKPDKGSVHIERPLASPSNATPDSSSVVDSPNEPYGEPLSEGEEDEIRDVAVAAHESSILGITGDEVIAAISYREQHMVRPPGVTDDEHAVQEQEEDDDDDARTPYLRRTSTVQPRMKTRLPSINPLDPATVFDKKLLDSKLEATQKSQPAKPSVASGSRSTRDLEDEDQQANGDERHIFRLRGHRFGKRVAVPVRIEPKVYFALERTFLKWLQFAVFIGTIATTLLNFTSPDDTRGLISAAAFTFAALLAIAYSAVIFVYRALRLRKRHAEGLYYDKYGPTILCFVVFGALVLNVVLRLTQLDDS